MTQRIVAEAAAARIAVDAGRCQGRYDKEITYIELKNSQCQMPLICSYFML